MTPAVFLASICGMGLLFVLALSIWSKREIGRDSGHRFRVDPAPSFLSGELELEARRMLGQGKKISAIKMVRSATGWDLKQAKEAVERLERTQVAGSRGTAPRFVDRSSVDPALDNQIRELLSDRRRIEAVKLVKDRTGWDLREAKEYVERIGRVRLDDY